MTVSSHGAGCRMCGPAMIAIATACAAVLPSMAHAQVAVSGHVGVAFPLVTYTSNTPGNNVTTLNDNFTVLFPFGVGIKPEFSPVVLDFEFVPEVHTDTRSTTLLVHPGVILPLEDGWAVGLRAAFEVNQNAIGFTPLVNKSFPIPGHSVRWFVEGDLPVRFLRQNGGTGSDATSVGLAFHTGLAF